MTEIEMSFFFLKIELFNWICFEMELIQIHFCFINRLLGIYLLIIKKKLIYHSVKVIMAKLCNKVKVVWVLHYQS